MSYFLAVERDLKECNKKTRCWKPTLRHTCTPWGRGWSGTSLELTPFQQAQSLKDIPIRVPRDWYNNDEGKKWKRQWMRGFERRKEWKRVLILPLSLSISKQRECNSVVVWLTVSPLSSKYWVFIAVKKKKHLETETPCTKIHYDMLRYVTSR
jgi:hypothetical protein